jgi:hypothetical protein
MSLMCLVRLCSVCFIVPAVVLIIRGEGAERGGGVENFLLGIADVELLTLELLTLAPKKAIAYFAVDLLTLNTYLS